MKIIRIVATLILLSVFLFSIEGIALDSSKIDAHLKLLIEQPQFEKLYQAQHPLLSKSTNESYIKVLIKTSASPAILKDKGLIIHHTFGKIVSGQILIDRLAELSDIPEVKYIQMPKIYKPLLDVSLGEINAPAVYQNYNVTGKGIIIGIIDTGIDWNHGDFKNPNGSTRIKYLLDLSIQGNSAGGGKLYTEQDINNAIMGIGTIQSRDVVGHGSHVAGIAAGNGRSTGTVKQYVGVAPEADLVVVKATRFESSTSFESDDYLIALRFIDSIATVLGKPYVANLSFGSNEGPHDGTLLEEQKIDEMFNSAVTGKAIVIAAGNDGDRAIHASGTLTQTQTSIESKFKIYEYTQNPSTSDDYVQFEMWYDGQTNHAIQLVAPDGSKYGPVKTGKDNSYNTSNGTINILNSSTGENGDHQVLIQVFDCTADKPPKVGEWKIIVTGTSGRFDIWLSAATMSTVPVFTSNIDKTMIAGSPGTAKNAITVGAYTTKNEWIDYDGNHLRPDPNPELYQISSFSSPGPTRDWRTKPEITAPGEMIGSTYSQDASPTSEFSVFNTQNETYPNGYILRDGKHALSQGTSMATPHVAGVIALMFEKFPLLDIIQIKEALVKTAKHDEFTLTVPNTKWGYGKLDAYEAMNYIAGTYSEPKFTVSIHQNPALTQFIDFYLIAKNPLQSTPTATMQVGDSSPTAIAMTESEVQLYKGEYKFSSNGTAVLTIKATAQGEPMTTLTEYFGVKLLKPGIESFVSFDKLSLAIPQNSFDKETYVTIFQENSSITTNELTPIGKTYLVSPGNHSLNQIASLTMSYTNEAIKDVDESKLSIFTLENDEWIKLKSQVDFDRNTITAPISKLGTYQIFYDPDAESVNSVPESYSLYQNFPNPFNAHTTISFQIPENQRISIKIYNIKGEYVTTLFDGFQNAGYHKMTWDGLDANNQPTTSGLYIYRLTAKNFMASQKMLLLK